MLTNNLFKRWKYKFFAPDRLQRETYEAFKRLLEYDRRCHELIADFQDLFYKNEPTGWVRVCVLYGQLSYAVGAMVNELAAVSPLNASELLGYYKKFDSYIRYLLQPQSNSSSPPYVLWLDDSRAKPQLTGNKAANLAVIHQGLDYTVPAGFVVTTNSWHALVEFNDLRPEIDSQLLALDPSDSNSLRQISQSLVALIEEATIPPEVDHRMKIAVANLVERTGADPQNLFAVRSSAVSEDGPSSFAGQYHSLLEVSQDDVQRSYLAVLASKYSPKALLYRINAGISDAEASMAVLVMEMVAAKAAGVIYTEDPSGEEEDTVFIRCVAGGGEKLVSGKAQPHLTRFNKEKETLTGQELPVCPISQEEVQKLARLATDLENFFDFPQDIEWAIGEGNPCILQSRPLKTAPLNAKSVEDAKAQLTNLGHSEEGASLDDPEKDKQKNLGLLYQGGVMAAQGRGTGPAFFFTEENDPLDFPAGGVLIVDNIPASLILLLSRCSAVVSKTGSVASHFSTICREFGVPLLVAAEGLADRAIQGEEITVDADHQRVYRGRDESCSDRSADSGRGKKLPYFRRLQPILDFIAPLSILDPESDEFAPGSCRSFHDIVRFAHETGVRAMFAIGKGGSRKGQRKQLATDLPFDLYLVDVDGGFREDQVTDRSIRLDQIVSTPFRALWQGLTHSSVSWGDHEYYNWKEYDSVALTDGFAFKNSKESASYAVCGHDYLNLNIRFGYHFTIVDSLCGENSDQNYCSIRFSGGGGTFEGRYYRLQFIETILRKIGFQVTTKTDLLDGRLESHSKEEMVQSLVTLGRMLGTSKQMDMVLRDEESVVSHLDLFFDSNDVFVS